MSQFVTLSSSNSTNERVPLSFNGNFSIPLLNKSSDYDISILRFKIPNFTTPMVTFKQDFYKMYMSYNSFSVDKYIDFISRTDTTTYYIYDFQQIIQMLNKAVNDLFTALGALTTLPTSLVPYFYYNEETKLISFVAHEDYYASDLALPIVISVNEPLFMWIATLPCKNNLLTQKYDILVMDTKNNIVDGYAEMRQEANTLDLLSDFNSLIFTTNLPVANEYQGDRARIPILQDFIPSDLDITTYYNSIVYNANVPYRQTRITSDINIYDVKIDCYISNVDGTLRRAELPPLHSANIKLMFTEHSRNKYA